jgi:Tol biopolymer transport system component
MRVLRLVVLTWITGLIWFWLGAGIPLSAKAQGGDFRVFLPLALQTMPGILSDYLVLLTSDYDGDQDVYRVRADGTDSTQLTFDFTATGDPKFAPDGSLILYRLGESSTEDNYYVMNEDGSDSQLAAPIPGRDDLALWSPSGTGFAFRNRNPTTLTSDLYWASLDSETPLLIDENVQTFAWSPDGSRLGYTISRLVGNVTYFDLYLFTPTTGVSEIVTIETGKNFGWSPDSYTIAFSARRNNNNELFTVTVADGTILQLTQNAVDDDFSGWVDNGAGVLFTRALAVLESPRNIYRINADGSGETRLTNSSDFKQVLSIAPTGSHFIFSRVATTEESQQLYLQQSSSTTSNAISENICIQNSTTTCGWGNITWAANGQQLAYHQFQRPRPGQPGSPQNEIFLTTLNGNSALSELLNSSATSPTWLLGSPYILAMATPGSGGIPIPHSIDTRTAQRFPLTGLGEDAFIYDWRYDPQ